MWTGCGQKVGLLLEREKRGCEGVMRKRWRDDHSKTMRTCGVERVASVPCVYGCEHAYRVVAYIDV